MHWCNLKVKLTSMRVVIRNHPWDFQKNPLYVLWIPSWYLYWAITMVYFHRFLHNYDCIKMDVKLHTSLINNGRVCHCNMYGPNSSNPRLPSFLREVVTLTKRHGIPISPNGSFTVSVTFYFPLLFFLVGKCRVVLVVHLFLRFFMFIITTIITFYEFRLELFDGAKIFLPLVS